MTASLTHLPYQADGGLGERAKLGLVALATEYVLEQDYRTVLSGLTGVALYTARVPMAAEVTPDTLRAMEHAIEPAASLLLPGEPLDVIAYGCSSATALLGEDKVKGLIQAAKPGSDVTTPITAARAALAAFSAQRIAILTPYTAKVNEGLRTVFEAARFDVPVFGSYDEPREGMVGRISEASIHASVVTLAARAEVDAVFISCTNLRGFGAVPSLEQALDLPVTSSNHAMIWHSLRCAGVTDPMPQFGRLYGF
ncbi:MAG: Asp/Glu racemase [Pseudomonadota bacterium]